MSEFKVGDLVKMKDDTYTWMDRVAAIEYKSCFNSKWDRSEIEVLVFEDGTKLGSGWVVHVDQAAGHRIDKPSNSGELETLDKPENHISPLCKSKDV